MKHYSYIFYNLVFLMLKNFQISKYCIILIIKIKFFLIVPIILYGQNELKIGIEKTEAYLPLINDKNVAIVSNHTSKFYNSNKSIHLVDSLLKLDINIIKVFAPEHGFRGNSDAGEKIGNTVDLKTGLHGILVTHNEIGYWFLNVTVVRKIS